jgi:hypothetical protein
VPGADELLGERGLARREVSVQAVAEIELTVSRLAAGLDEACIAAAASGVASTRRRRRCSSNSPSTAMGSSARPAHGRSPITRTRRAMGIGVCPEPTRFGSHRDPRIISKRSPRAESIDQER